MNGDRLPTMARVLVILLLSVLGSGCSSSAEPRRSTAPPRDSFPVGSEASFRIYAHCGVQFARIDGDTWRTKLRDDGNGNPPKGWPQLIAGTLTRPSADRAVFTSDEIPAALVFHPAPHATYICD